MATSKQTLYEPLQYYHIYNRANGWENIFLEEENYYYFLKKYAEKLDDVVKTLAYCLMPNHFHLLIQVRSSGEIYDFIEDKKKQLGNIKIPKTVETQEQLNHFIVQRQLTNFLGGYVKAFNKYHQRKGSLFQQNTCRKLVENSVYFRTAIR
ncbi:MAG: transposase [Bacteroidota bacterium]